MTTAAEFATSSPRYAFALETAVQLARQAGGLIRTQFFGTGGLRGHGGHAAVDASAEQLIRSGLAIAFPQHGQRGEELGDEDRPATDAEGHVWLIDPHDGTSDANKGHRGAAVSIALLRAGTPVLGVVYTYAAPGGGHDLVSWAEGCGPVQRKGVDVTRRPWGEAVNAECVVLMSQSSETNAPRATAYAQPARVRCLPSIAYRLALVAAGDADAATSFNGPIDWDYAGGHALLIGAEGHFLDRSGHPVVYAPAGQSSVGGACVGGSPLVAADLVGRSWPAGQAPAAHAPRFGLVQPAPGFVVADEAMVQRACGCLMGQLAGDSLGSFVEFQSDTKIRKAFPQGLRLLRDGGHWNLLAGQPTDDSELALLMARSIVATGRYDPVAAAAAYGYWYATKPFDIGTTTRQAVMPAAAALTNGGNPFEAARKAASTTSESNGSLMRISPLGIYGAILDSGQVVELAMQDSSVTHAAPLCRSAAGVFAATLAHAIRAGGTPEEVYGFALELAETEGVDSRLVVALQRAKREAPNREDFVGSSQGWVLVAFQNAFFQLLNSESLEDGVVDSVMRGGDTDTNAAIAGALLGAVHGMAQMPLQWTNQVLTCRPLAGLEGVHHPRPMDFWPVDALALAERLLWSGMRQ